MSAGQKSAPPFIVLWRKALLRSGLPPAVRHVGHVLAEYADTASGRNAFPGAQTIAEDTGISRRRVLDHRQALVRAGFAVEEVKGGSLKNGQRQSSRFRLTIPTSDKVSPVLVNSGHQSPDTTSDKVSPVLVTKRTPTSDKVSPVLVTRCHPTGPGPDHLPLRAPGASRPPLASAGSDGAKADEDEDRPLAEKQSDNGADDDVPFRVFVKGEPPLPKCLAPTPDKRPLPDELIDGLDAWAEDFIWDWAEEVHEKRGGCKEVDWSKTVRDFIAYYSADPEGSKNWIYVWRRWAERAAAKAGQATRKPKTELKAQTDESSNDGDSLASYPKRIECDDCADDAYVIGERLGIGITAAVYECASEHRTERHFELKPSPPMTSAASTARDLGIIDDEIL